MRGSGRTRSKFHDVAVGERARRTTHMRFRSRQTSALAVAAITGLGLPLLVSTVGTTSAAAASRKPTVMHYNRSRAVAESVEKQMERKGFQAKRAAYYDSRRAAGTRPLTVVQAAKAREAAVKAAGRLRRSGASHSGTASLRAAAVGPTWQSITPPDTFQAGRTTGAFEEVSGRVSALAVDTT